MASTKDEPVWFITGCSSGFGRELGKAVIARGWNAVLTARNPASLDELIADVSGRAIALQLDVTQADQIEAAVNTALAHFGRIDVLVNNAGYGYNSTIEEAEEAEVRAVFETNFFGLFRLTQTVLPIMRQQREGHIINVGSLAGTFATASGAFYAATKHAVEAFTEALAAECATIGVGVTVVEPGAFLTDFVRRSLKSTPTKIPEYKEATEAQMAALRGIVKDRRFGDPARGAQAIIEAYLADKPPLRLPLGMDACPMIAAMLERRLAEMEVWREVANAAAAPSV